MSKPALDVLRRSDGWKIGTGPSVVVDDEGTTRRPSTAGPQGDIFAIVFTQKGLMAA
jgi:hypothetical protein